MVRVHDFLVRLEKVKRLTFNDVLLAKLIDELLRKNPILQVRDVNTNVVLPCSVILQLQSEIMSLCKKIQYVPVSITLGMEDYGLDS